MFTGGPFSDPITAWNVSLFAKTYSVDLHTAGVTQLLELRGTNSNMLVSSSMDGSVVIFDMQSREVWNIVFFYSPVCNHFIYNIGPFFFSIAGTDANPGS